VQTAAASLGSGRFVFLTGWRSPDVERRERSSREIIEPTDGHTQVRDAVRALMR
jgi:hypothetical protein